MSKVRDMYVLHSIVQKGDKKCLVASVEPTVVLQNLEEVPIETIKRLGVEGEYLSYMIDKGAGMPEIRRAVEALNLEYKNER